jgi:cobalt-zinc-cadmium efflux system protein
VSGIHKEKHLDHSHSETGGAHVHAHAPADFGRAFAIGTALNTLFVLIEVIFGLLSNSTALLADAGHNVSDILGLVVAWTAATLARRPPTIRYTYGLSSSSILAASFNAMLLLVAVGAIGWEAIQRISTPEPVAGATVIVVAAVGIVVNGFSAWMFMSGREQDINIEGAFLHLAADAAVSAGVVLAGIGIYFTGKNWLDPLASLLICGAILWSTWRLLKSSLRMSLAAVPEGIDPVAVRKYLGKLPGVSEVHDLHIWPISTTVTALTAHLVMPDGHPGDRLLKEVAEELHSRFSIEHATIQIEIDELAMCRLAPKEVI